MKKKKQKSTAAITAATTTTTTATSTADLKALIHSHTLFFDNLIELIPSKFYLSNDDVLDSKPWYQGLSKAAKASAKQQTLLNLKKARRHRLDPDQSQNASTLHILNQTLHSQTITKIPTSPSSHNAEDETRIEPVSNFNGGDVTFEEIRQKLRRKIELLRGNRGNSERKETQFRKRKRVSEFGKDSENGRGGNFGENEGLIGKNVVEATKGIEFGKLRIGDESGRKKQKRASKANELDRVKRLEEAKKGNPVVAERESWKAATSRAMGVKVHDDPRMLRESMKKEKRRHEKNVGKWKERVESREKEKGEKQTKRADNIAERVQQKKMRKIAKREKKLMRPGFEGRKEGYITQD